MSHVSQDGTTVTFLGISPGRWLCTFITWTVQEVQNGKHWGCVGRDCWIHLLNTSDTVDTFDICEWHLWIPDSVHFCALAGYVSFLSCLWRDHRCRRLNCCWQRLPFRHVSTVSIHTGLQKKVNLDELGQKWWGRLQVISWIDTTLCKYNGPMKHDKVKHD